MKPDHLKLIQEGCYYNVLLYMWKFLDGKCSLKLTDHFELVHLYYCSVVSKSVLNIRFEYKQRQGFFKKGMLP